MEEKTETRCKYTRLLHVFIKKIWVICQRTEDHFNKMISECSDIIPRWTRPLKNEAGFSDTT